MSNIRIIHLNLADISTISASSTSGTLVPDNMKNNYKGSIHRSTSTSVTYTVSFSGSKLVGGVALPATNLTADATIRVRLYSGGTAIADSTTIFACPGETLDLWNWNLPLNANAFIYGGASKTAVWFNSHYSCTSVVIDIVDTNNTAGYIDCARLIVGEYWEPTYNVSNDISVSIVDSSTSSRNDAGDLLSDRGSIYDQISFNLGTLLDVDKNHLMKILRHIGTSKNFLVSVFPDNNSVLEQSHIVYGKRSNSGIGMELFGIYNHSMEMEGW